jgi:hypothetical protein
MRPGSTVSRKVNAFRQSGGWGWRAAFDGRQLLMEPSEPLRVSGFGLSGLLESLDSNYLGWSSAMAPVIMGRPERTVLGEELTNSFCRTDPAIARRFARATFLSDNRADLARIPARTPCSTNRRRPRGRPSTSACCNRRRRTRWRWSPTFSI